MSNIGGVSFSGSAAYWSQGVYPRVNNQADADPANPLNPDRIAVNPDADNQKQSKSGKVKNDGECQTCNGRKYQDGSGDPGVSFKTPTKVDPKQAAGAVRGHELQHVSRERSKAQAEDREVVNQSVTYRSAICPECGTSYVSGGTTRTTTRSKEAQKFDVGLEGQDSKGVYLDKVA